jgi:hypothetical protein
VEQRAHFLFVSSPSLIQFFCTLCGGSLTVAAEFAWNTCECSLCGRNVPVPGLLADEVPQWETAFSGGIRAVEMTFACPGCDRSLLADVRWGGRTFTCPKCDTTGEVPHLIRFRTKPAESEAPPAPQVATLTAAEIEFLSSLEPEPVTAHAG